MILLSTPFTYKAQDDSEEELRNKKVIENFRHEMTLRMANHLFNLGHYVFSPIVYGLSLIQNGLKLPPTWEFWQKFCEESVQICSEVWVLNFPGWDKSTGVAGEIEEAKKHNKKVYLIEFDLDGPVKFIKEL